MVASDRHGHHPGLLSPRPTSAISSKPRWLTVASATYKKGSHFLIPLKVFRWFLDVLPLLVLSALTRLNLTSSFTINLSLIPPSIEPLARALSV